MLYAKINSILNIFLLISSMTLAAQQNQKVIDRNYLLSKKGVLYTKTKNKPFTGIVVTYHTNGLFQSISECMKGQFFGVSCILNKQEKVVDELYYVRGTADGNILRWVNDVKSRNMGMVINQNDLIDKDGVFYLQKSLKPFTGIALTYKEKQINLITQYVNGQLCGINYTLSQEGEIISKKYNHNGTYKTISAWGHSLNSKDGKEYIPISYLYPKDGLVYKRSNKTLFSGVAVSYHTNGQPQAEITYVDGLADGPATLYSHEGEVTKKMYFDKEKIPFKKSFNH